ncbi:hypothetical protein GCM10018962_15230 [Dactylosporangium matsuzakiense]|uniref:Peptidase M23-like protein n=1 Tax=Dactylosporangium matsuzakiense TaxID=53360 RepID=A0A9W6KUW6_9ACTN|nr:hypothetical protein GCM10017581_102890 [Dactylosporangium matsuzakiense]
MAVVLAQLGMGEPAHASTPTPAVWVGAPFEGNWPTGDSLPAVHNRAYGGDWAADLVAPQGTPVYLYAAPQNTALTITAVVDVVGPACASGRLDLGGKRVTIGLWNGNTKIGAVTYAHLETGLTAGTTVSRWGTLLGTVGHYTPGSCWDGDHSHVELYNQARYACYNRGYAPAQRFYPTNFIGFVGGDYATGTGQACP